VKGKAVCEAGTGIFLSGHFCEFHSKTQKIIYNKSRLWKKSRFDFWFAGGPPCFRPRLPRLHNILLETHTGKKRNG